MRVFFIFEIRFAAFQNRTKREDSTSSRGKSVDFVQNGGAVPSARRQSRKIASTSKARR
jgi:hypothetical protein